LTVNIVDNCHNSAPQATVSVSFSNGDKLSPPLVNQGNGIWTGTWTPKTAGAQVAVSVVAIEEQGLTVTSGLLQLTGTVQSAASTEAPAPAAALNSANATSSTQISPGSWVTIFGDRMATGTSSASGIFPPSLVGTAVMIGSTALPLEYVGPAQVNALLPFILTPNTTVSLAVQRSGTVSVPIGVTIGDLRLRGTLFRHPSRTKHRRVVRLVGSLYTSPGDAATLLATAKRPPRRVGPWEASLDDNEVRRYRSAMDRGKGPPFAAALRFDTGGALIGGRQVLEALQAPGLALITVTVIAGLAPEAEGQY
jgi:hypothetical protein